MKTIRTDEDGDWTFELLNEPQSIVESIKTRLKCFKNDCVYDLDFGFDLNDFDKGTEENLVNMASSIIRDTEKVSSIKEISYSLNSERKLIINFTAILEDSSEISDMVDINL